MVPCVSEDCVSRPAWKTNLWKNFRNKEGYVPFHAQQPRSAFSGGYVHVHHLYIWQHAFWCAYYCEPTAANNIPIQPGKLLPLVVSLLCCPLHPSLLSFHPITNIYQWLGPILFDWATASHSSLGWFATWRNWCMYYSIYNWWWAALPLLI